MVTYVQLVGKTLNLDFRTFPTAQKTSCHALRISNCGSRKGSLTHGHQTIPALQLCFDPCCSGNGRHTSKSLLLPATANIMYRKQRCFLTFYHCLKIVFWLQHNIDRTLEWSLHCANWYRRCEPVAKPLQVWHKRHGMWTHSQKCPTTKNSGRSTHMKETLFNSQISVGKAPSLLFGTQGYC